MTDTVPRKTARTKTFVSTIAGTLLVLSPALHAEVSETVERTVALASDGRMHVEGINGSIQVRAWDRNEVHVIAHKKAKDAAALGEIELEIESSGNQVSIESQLSGGWGKQASVCYEISMPAGASASVEAVNGAVAIQGVQGEVDVEAVNGAVQVEAARGPVSVETVNGAQTVGYGSVPESGPNRFESVNGRVTVFLPGSMQGSFQAETVNGGIQTDFPLKVEKAKWGPSSSLDGQLGSGGADFSFETVNGRVRILMNENVESRVLEYHTDRVR